MSAAKVKITYHLDPRSGLDSTSIIMDGPWGKHGPESLASVSDRFSPKGGMEWMNVTGESSSVCFRVADIKRIVYTEVNE